MAVAECGQMPLMLLLLLPLYGSECGSETDKWTIIWQWEHFTCTKNKSYFEENTITILALLPALSVDPRLFLLELIQQDAGNFALNTTFHKKVRNTKLILPETQTLLLHQMSQSGFRALLSLQWGEKEQNNELAVEINPREIKLYSSVDLNVYRLILAYVLCELRLLLTLKSSWELKCQQTSRRYCGVGQSRVTYSD